jgi:membrane protease YdiL (CAAX protease family)
MPDPEIERDRVPWALQQTITGALLTIIPWIAFSLLLSGSKIQNAHATTAHLTFTVDLITAIVTFIISALAEGLFLIAPLYSATRVFRTFPSRLRLALQALGFRGFRVGNAIGWVVCLFFGVLLVNQFYGLVITNFHLNIQTNDQAILRFSKTAPITTYATLLVAVIVAPFCEEVFFRGFLFAGLLRGMPVAVAIVVSSLVFGIAHVDPGSFPVLFIIGLALAFLRWRTRSLWPGILLHMLNNGLSALVIVLSMWGIIRLP